MYSVSSSNFSYCVIYVYSSSFTLYLYVLINFEFCLIIQQELAEASNIALNHYNETHLLEKTSEGVSKAMSITVNKKRVMFFFLILQNNWRLPTSTLYLLSLKKLSTIGVHFRCLKCYKINFMM